MPRRSSRRTHSTRNTRNDRSISIPSNINSSRSTIFVIINIFIRITPNVSTCINIRIIARRCNRNSTRFNMSTRDNTSSTIVRCIVSGLL